MVDYKTDQVRSPQILAERYKEQLDYYGRALEQMTGKRVKEKIIFSLSMGREIVLEENLGENLGEHPGRAEQRGKDQRGEDQKGKDPGGEDQGGKDLGGEVK